jgi:hypothetical protein
VKDELVTAQEAAQRLGLAASTIYTWRDRGYLAPYATYRAAIGGIRRPRMVFLWSDVLRVDADRRDLHGAGTVQVDNTEHDEQ